LLVTYTHRPKEEGVFEMRIHVAGLHRGCSWEQREPAEAVKGRLSRDKKVERSLVPMIRCDWLVQIILAGS
jgi:hypothetical protein